ncbi:galanin peptides isoform X3 [Heterocephalus glaber]|uniref:Galanin peptides n=1 Tax=Heterocephalus glaber TaxID=10181 RepID=A0AAX6TH06_HETGA|nr:galanin peptides isoform X3 [Heterocephalus glaber]
MARAGALLLLSLLLVAALPATLVLGAPAKEKRGWTLNSAGYLLGPPDAIDNHRSFSDKHGLAGKRELQLDGDLQTGSFDRSLPENNIVRTIIEFLTFLHLKG